jgi:septal ring factor EnvC (AmiA/AmiB activator)
VRGIRGRLARVVAAAVATLAPAIIGPAAAIEKPQPPHHATPLAAAAEKSGPAGASAAELAAADLDAVRQRCIALAREMQQRERAINTLDIAIGAMVQAVDATTAQLDQSRKQQERLLAALERLARSPPATLAVSPGGPVDRARSAILMAAAVPALGAAARDLTGQLGAMQAVRARVDTSRRERDKTLAVLNEDRGTLARLAARRGALTGQLLRDDGKGSAADQAGEQASDLFDLIKRADADNERRDRDLALRLQAGATVTAKATAPVDPSKPRTLRAFDAPRAMIELPVQGTITQRFGEADPSGRPSQGLTISVLPGGVVTAPFDGRIDYAANFRGAGPILIIRHGGGYHSLLAGLGRVDVKPGQWVLAGEPVGALPDAEDSGARPVLHLELRREGRPVDPESRLASRDEKTGDSRVRQ